jgi:hypothetical protein
MKRKLIFGIAATFVLLLFTFGLPAAQDESNQSTAYEPTPSAFLPVTKWEFNPIVEGEEVIHDFVIQNKGDALLNVSKVKTG